MDKGENTLESRADWIDVLKGIGIILVVIGHVNTKGFLVQWLYTFHMPLFFALSGYILYKFGKNIPFQKFLLKRTKSILWPFILFSCCPMVCFKVGAASELFVIVVFAIFKWFNVVHPWIYMRNR